VAIPEITRKAQQHGDQDRRRPPDAHAPQQPDQRRQHEAQQERQGDGDEDFTPEIERGNRNNESRWRPAEHR
jgi:hypothetical protein